MPQIPYSPAATVNPQGAPGAFISGNGDNGAGLVAGAVQGMGKTLQQSADRMEDNAIKLATIDNDTTAKNLEVGAITKMADERAKFSSMSEEEAKAYYPTYQTNLKKIYDDSVKSSPNPMVQKTLQGSLGFRFAREYDMGASHFAQESKKANLTATGALATAAAREAVNSKDDEGFEENLKDALYQVEDGQKKIGKSDPLSIKNAKQDAADKIIGDRLSSVSLQDPERAHDLFTKYSDTMSQQARDAAEKKIQTDIVRKQTRTVADDIVNGADGYGNYEKRLFGKESGNDPNAQAKGGSASGLGQITKDTWNDIRKAHPELELDSFEKGAKNAEQNAKASKAFTMDNAKILEDSDIVPNQKNLYMTHFLGKAGGPAFISAMKDDPKAAAAPMFPDAAAANKSVFFNKDGSSKTLEQVYNNQTFKFSSAKLTNNGDTGLKPLTPQSTQADVNKLVEAGRSRFEGNPEAQDKVESYIKQKGASVIAESKDIQKKNFQYVVAGLQGKDGGARPTSLEDLFKNESMRDAYYAMDLDQQNRIDKALIYAAERNKKQDVPLTPERIEQARELHGLFYTDREKFNKLVIDGYDLPNDVRKELMKKQMQVDKPKEPKESAEWDVTGILGKLDHFDVPNVLKLDRKKRPQEYQQYIGEVEERLNAAKAQGKTLTEQDIRQMGVDIVKNKITKPGRIYGTNESPEFKTRDPLTGARTDASPYPKDMVDDVTKQFAAKNGGKAPTADQFKQIYQKNKSFLDRKYGLSNG